MCVHRIILDVSPWTKCLWESFINDDDNDTDNNYAEDKMIITWKNQSQINR